MPANRKNPALALFLGFLGACLFVGFGVFGLYRNWQFSGAVTHVQGLVQSLQVTYGRHTSRNIVYAYPGSTGERNAHCEIGQDLYERLHRGEAIPVVYFSSDDSVSRIDDPVENARLEHRNEFSIGFGVFFGFVVFCFWKWGRPR